MLDIDSSSRSYDLTTFHLDSTFVHLYLSLVRYSTGYEVEGLENIPATGPVLIVFYHAALPIDFYYVFAKIWLYRNRRVRVVADKFVFKIPGLCLAFVENIPETFPFQDLRLCSKHWRYSQPPQRCVN
jgi:1-acyl-sn-glycerol-3-phosphate acyltransferase